MPIFTLYTNVCQSDVPQTLVFDLYQLLEKALDVPAKHFAIMIHAEQQLTFGGTSDPCAVCTLQTIAKYQNEKYSKLICEILSKELHINPERVYIHFIDANRANVGWNSTTFATITF